MTACQGINPLTSEKGKENITTTTSKTTAPTQIILTQYFLSQSLVSVEVIKLNIVQRWIDSGSKRLNFKSLNPPYVVNTAIKTKTSKVISDLTILVYRKGDPYKISDFPITTRFKFPDFEGVQAFIIKEKGDYVIDVTSVGCEWWVAVGHESEAYRQ